MQAAPIAMVATAKATQATSTAAAATVIAAVAAAEKTGLRIALTLLHLASSQLQT